MQRKEVQGVTAGAPRLEVRQDIPRVYFGVESLRVPELADPCICDDGEHELCRLPSRGVVRGAVSAPRLVCRLEACSDDGRGIVVYGEVVCPDPCGFGEGFAVALEVCRLCLDDTYEVMYSARLVIRDL